MRTTIEWANHYENLKRYEIDHKKSSGSYLWVFSFEDPKAFKTWLSLSPEDRAKTGVYQKKTPGGFFGVASWNEGGSKEPSITQDIGF